MRGLIFLFFCIFAFAYEPMLLKSYKGDENLSGWVMSEKLDGVRGIWARNLGQNINNSGDLGGQNLSELSSNIFRSQKNSELNNDTTSSPNLGESNDKSVVSQGHSEVSGDSSNAGSQNLKSQNLKEQNGLSQGQVGENSPKNLRKFILQSRNKKAFNPPLFFTACFPPFELDGELYAPNFGFEKITSIVNSNSDKGWKGLKLYVFDAPTMAGNLRQRLGAVGEFLDKNPCKFIEIIPQFDAISHENVRKFFDKVTKNGGEGVVVRDANAPYKSGRSDKILKLKAFRDAECEVVAHIEGKGKFKGVLGSLICEDLKSGVRFRIGSGFSENERVNPPKIGQVVSYKFQDLTKNGVPKFPVFLRVRADFGW